MEHPPASASLSSSLSSDSSLSSSSSSLSSKPSSSLLLKSKKIHSILHRYYWIHRIHQLDPFHEYNDDNLYSSLNKRKYSYHQLLLKLIKDKRRMNSDHNKDHHHNIIIINRLLNGEIFKLRGWRPQRYG
ncbi:unnamed protein product [Schistosoma rodhaini]|nr:unnamed protein product [Schistosoma rodhaini]